MSIMIAKGILIFLAAVQAVATPFYDFNRAHLHNSAWPAHAKYHCVAYTLLLVGNGLVSIALVLCDRSAFAVALLGWAGALQFLSCLFPGVTPVADGERVIKGLPVSLWGTLLYLGLTAAAACLLLS